MRCVGISCAPGLRVVDDDDVQRVPDLGVVHADAREARAVRLEQRREHRVLGHLEVLLERRDRDPALLHVEVDDRREQRRVALDRLARRRRELVPRARARLVRGPPRVRRRRRRARAARRGRRGRRGGGARRRARLVRAPPTGTGRFTGSTSPSRCCLYASQSAWRCAALARREVRLLREGGRRVGHVGVAEAGRRRAQGGVLGGRCSCTPSKSRHERYLHPVSAGVFGGHEHFAAPTHFAPSRSFGVPAQTPPRSSSMYASSRRATTGRRRPREREPASWSKRRPSSRAETTGARSAPRSSAKRANGGAGGVVEARAADKATPEDGRVSPKKSVVGRVSPKKPVVGFCTSNGPRTTTKSTSVSSCTGFVTVFSEGDQSPARHAGCFALDMFGFSSSTV